MKDYSEYSDNNLFEMFCKDNANKQDIFTEIYNRYSISIYNYCYHTLLNVQDANDVTQEVFIRFYQHSSQIETTSSLKGYLYKIARNQCLFILKKRIEKIPINEDDIEFNEKSLENEELSKLINQAIEKLPYALREVFVLRFVQGMDYNEIEAITMIKNTTLRTKISRALSKMQELLKPYFIENIKEQNK